MKLDRPKRMKPFHDELLNELTKPIKINKYVNIGTCHISEYLEKNMFPPQSLTQAKII